MTKHKVWLVTTLVIITIAKAKADAEADPFPALSATALELGKRIGNSLKAGGGKGLSKLLNSISPQGSKSYWLSKPVSV